MLSSETTQHTPLPPSIPIGFAPSLPSMMRAEHEPTDLLSLQPGQHIADFQIIALLGRGGFGAVYLAWDVSLGRQIALKISPCMGQEGRTLARLDHPHIVRVYSETIHQQSRLLCMQYVASMALDVLLQRLKATTPNWTGGGLLSLIDAQHAHAAEFDPAQLADRQALSQLDHVNAVCWLGSRMADALAHAHRHGVLHRDLKPGNILVSQYGRPMLVDFNLANVTQEKSTASQLFGGTLPYMSPEHLEAFDPMHPSDEKAVTEQSDIYSLGVVLFELLTGKLPFPSYRDGGTLSDRLSKMVFDRKQPQLVWRQPTWETWKNEDAVQSVLQRALEAEPGQRWKSADDFSRALTDVLELRSTLRNVSENSKVARRLSLRPFVFLAIFGLVPHFFGSLVNIPYNLLRVAGTERLAVFAKLVNVYNVTFYPLCVAMCIWVAWPVFQWWRKRPTGEDANQRAAWLRQRVVWFPIHVINIALFGWLPGAIWFPWGLSTWVKENPITWSDVFHLQFSVAISGLIALTYSALGVSVMSMFVFYPKLWINPTDFRALAREEVRPLRTLLRVIPALALTIPLVGAVLMISTGRSTYDDAEFRTFKWLTTGLITFGMIGFQLAVFVTAKVRRAVDAFAGESTS